MVTGNYCRTALLLGVLTALLLAGGWGLGGRIGLLVALGLAAVSCVAACGFADRLVLARYRARLVSEAEAPRLHAMLDRLVRRAGLPKPRLYVLPETSPNAFAIGRDPAHASVAMTAGLLSLMDQDEVEGVMAHELAHIKHRDVLVASVAATIAGGVTMLAGLARFDAIFGGPQGRGDRDVGLPALLATAVIAPVAAMVIQMAVSRSREYAADATGAALAGSATGLVRALRKLGDASRKIPLDAAPATSHLFIVTPLSARGLGALFRTHPPVEDRIRRLLGGVR